MAGIEVAEQIRVQGLVQGVGFRPTVWRLAREIGLRGAVWNDSQGVEIHVCGEQLQIDRFCERLLKEPPPLASIESLDRQPQTHLPDEREFIITDSRSGEVQTGIVPDAATCDACLQDIRDPANRRYRYPFTNCTHCGPRLTLIEGIPYDRANTSMRHFPLCADCEAEYLDPADRRFHAQPNACPVCGPRVWLCNAKGKEIMPSREAEDALHEAHRYLSDGAILAIKGVGGFHLACDATNESAVTRLRERKGRYYKPFALMARDHAVIRNYCEVSEDEAALLSSSAAPIVLLSRTAEARLPENVAPQQTSLGFMLPYSPLHHLLLSGWDSPLVMTSGNRIEEPQCIDNQEAAERLLPLADLFLLHDREITNRVDDSVVRIMDGVPRSLRRARGYAPAPLQLPEGFEQAATLLAMGGELKNTFCLVRQGQAILSQHIGDLENLISYHDYLKNLDLYAALFDHRPARLVADLHPNYRSTQHAKVIAAERDLPLLQVQHHHAHIASVLADNGWPLRAGKVLGIALDGTGYGDDGTVWGGEFLLADYLQYQRLGKLQSIPLPGGSQAILQPWRNVFSHLHHHFGWQQVIQQWGDLEPIAWLNRQPVKVLTGMIEGGVNSPLSSSCGRLFDAVAALLNICRESISYEGQAAIELEAAAQQSTRSTSDGYALQTQVENEMVSLDSAALWPSLLDDLRAGHDRQEIAWRFHLGLAASVCEMATALAHANGVGTVALSGGVFQNKTLFELVINQLESGGFSVLSYRNVPSNDGGLALGQAVIGAARSITTG
ncbi:MAG: carbamoyltransferase HypF [Candidatus Thiodiazotropha sp.]|nr:carbamoyltransferase HypF [Candidatus Thiodiazotropha sp.]MCM8882888.1 carbamoyltransferase HypF [Candidatus Thiodiazotropha sp.]